MMNFTDQQIEQLKIASQLLPPHYCHRFDDKEVMHRTTLLLTIASLAFAAPPASALDYPATCRGASAAVTEISGLDTPSARMTARYTYPDAVSYCHYALGRGEGKSRPSAAAIASCATKFMRDLGSNETLHAEANCQIGTLSTSGANWSNAYKLPLQPTCGNDNNQAISLFQILCPSYEGQIEQDAQ
jgi:hypothetical protein